MNDEKFPFLIPFGTLTGALAGWLIAIVRGRPKGKRLPHVAGGALAGMGANAYNSIRVSSWAKRNPYGQVTTNRVLWGLMARAQQTRALELAQAQPAEMLPGA